MPLSGRTVLLELVSTSFHCRKPPGSERIASAIPVNEQGTQIPVSRWQRTQELDGIFNNGIWVVVGHHQDEQSNVNDIVQSIEFPWERLKGVMHIQRDVLWQPSFWRILCRCDVERVQMC